MTNTGSSILKIVYACTCSLHLLSQNWQERYRQISMEMNGRRAIHTTLPCPLLWLLYILHLLSTYMGRARFHGLQSLSLDPVFDFIKPMPTCRLFCLRLCCLLNVFGLLLLISSPISTNPILLNIAFNTISVLSRWRVFCCCCYCRRQWPKTKW